MGEENNPWPGRSAIPKVAGTDDTANTMSYWNIFADSFRALGPPLRPSAEDIRSMEEAASAWAAGHPGQPLHALLLGVTPEIAQMRWPDLASLMAVDSSMAMAKAVWPGNIPGRSWVVCGDWHALPRQERSCDFVVGDGSINCLSYPVDYRALAAVVHRVLRDDGLFVLRCYLRPALQETPEDVVARMAEFPSFHHFKFSLLMAMQRSVSEGIPVDRVHQFWASLKLEEEALAARTGWERPAIRTIESYRGTNTVHTFPNLAELRATLLECFDEVSLTTPSYSMGERCPTLVLKPLPGKRGRRGEGGGSL
jgi:SAM-dependent methyltransferase